MQRFSIVDLAAGGLALFIVTRASYTDIVNGTIACGQFAVCTCIDPPLVSVNPDCTMILMSAVL